MECPVCTKRLIAKITRPGHAGRPGIYFTCPEDSRHVRGFVNGPEFVRRAQASTDPAELFVKTV
jgi:hypothetical protein